MKKLVKNLANSYDHAVHYSYDQHGNVQTLLREIKGLVPLLNDYKLIDYTYDLVSGKVNEVAYGKWLAFLQVVNIVFGYEFCIGESKR